MFVCAALLVCLVIMTLFLAELTLSDLSFIVSTLFIGAMGLMIFGLILFLVEVSISTRRIREGIVEILTEEAESPPE
jgi:hypothetical protein